METKIYLVRHAEAAGNARGTFQGMTDCDVSLRGKKQLAQLKEYFKEISLDAVYASPLRRTRETARAVIAGRVIPLSIVKDLHEIHGGKWEGLTWAEIKAQYPKEFHAWIQQPQNFVAPEGESMRQVYDRMTKAIHQLAVENAGKTIAVVSHGCAICNYCCYAENIGWEHLGDAPLFGNTGVGLICYDDSESISVSFLNQLSHLSEDVMPKHYSCWRERFSQLLH